MTNDKEQSKKSNEIVGYVFVGCIVIGMGISFALGNMPVGLFIGVGVGFVAMAVIRFKTGQAKND